MTIYETKHQLYRDYCRELDTFRTIPKNYSEEDIRSFTDDYINDQNTPWINIFDEEHLAGFLIMAKRGAKDELHPDADYAVCQAYVAPAHRGKGLMKKALSEYVQSHPGIYCAIVLKGNKTAQRYWERRFEELGFAPAALTEFVLTGNDADEFKQFAWNKQ